MQEFRSIGVIAELFECCRASADRDETAKNLYFSSATLYECPSRSRSLKSDKQYEVFWIGQPLRQVMQNAPSRRHAARRNDDAGILTRVDFLRLLGRDRKCQAGPIERRTVFLDQVCRLRCELIGMLEENVNRFDRHRTVAVNGHTRNLA